MPASTMARASWLSGSVLRTIVTGQKGGKWKSFGRCATYLSADPHLPPSPLTAFCCRSTRPAPGEAGRCSRGGGNKTRRDGTSSYRGVQKSVGNPVISPPGTSLHSFVAIAPTLYGNNTDLWI